MGWLDGLGVGFKPVTIETDFVGMRAGSVAEEGGKQVISEEEIISTLQDEDYWTFDELFANFVILKKID